MLVVHVSVFAQSSGQVTLSIKLYPIQIIEFEASNAQVVEVSNRKEAKQSNNNSTNGSNLSTYSTTKYSLEVDTLINAPKQVGVSEHANTSVDVNAVNTSPIKEPEDAYMSDAEYQLMYSIKTL